MGKKRKSSGGFDTRKKVAMDNRRTELEIISTWSDDSGPSVLLNLDGERVVFNAGEGWQRICLEQGVRLSKVDLMCLTSLRPEFAGGIPGYCLTAADAGLAKLDMIGPHGLRALTAATHHFMRRESLHMQVEEILFGQDIAWHPAGPKDRALRLRAAALNTYCVAYLGETPPVLGRFDIAKAKALDIPSGPLYGQLKSGTSITLPNGRTISPDQVVEPTRPGASFAIVPCPSLDLIPVLSKLFASMTPDCVIHLAPAAIAKTSEYTQWYRTSLPQATHFLTHEHHLSPFRTALADTEKLYNIAPDLYAKIQESTPAQTSSHERNEFFAQPFLKYTLIPLDHKGPDLTRLEARAPAFSESDIQELPKCIDRRCSTPTERDNELNNDAELIFLGTGSAIPSKHRNVSAIFLRCSADAAMLLDAGEGTLGQLSKIFGSDAGLNRLAAVWISHPHADHHLGLPRILTQRAIKFPQLDPVVLMAPTPVLSWLRDYTQLLGPESRLASAYTAVDSTMICHPGAPHPCAHQLKSVLGIERCWNVRVNHCAHAYGLILHSTQGWSLCYSGDCRPTPELVRQAKQVSVLIHEATFEDDKYLDAVAKKHSTLSEAISIGVDMKALRTVLTHFSQRYPDLPLLKRGQGGSLVLASDFMTLSFPNLLWAPNLLPVLQAMHGHHQENRDDENLAGASLISES